MLTKADLDTIWAKENSARSVFVARWRAIIRKQFGREAPTVAAAEDTDKAIKATQPAWNTLLTRMYREASEQFGAETARRLMAQPSRKALGDVETTPTPTGVYDPWTEHYRRAVATLVGRKVTQVTDQTRDAVAKAVGAVSRTGGPDAAAKAIRKVYTGFSVRRSWVIARTEGAMAANYATHHAAMESGFVSSKTWVSSRDARVRESHRRVDGETVAEDARFSNTLRFPCDPEGPAHEVINCFPADVAVTVRDMEGGYRRLYSGVLIRIRDEFGNELPGTPNHPVATPTGWVPLGDIKPGDEILRGTFDICRPLPDPDVVGAPTQLGEVFDTLAGSGHGRGVAGAHVDFHGDGTTYSQVEVVGTYGQLGDTRMQPSKGLRKCLLTLPYLAQAALFGVGASGHTLRAVGFPANSTVGVADLVLPTLRGHAGPLEGLGFASRPGWDTQTPQSCADLEASTPQSTATARLPFQEQLANIGVKTVSVRVVSVVAEHFHGHVYNLQTSLGLYIGNGFLVKNCRCVCTYGYEAVERPTPRPDPVEPTPAETAPEPTMDAPEDVIPDEEDAAPEEEEAPEEILPAPQAMPAPRFEPVQVLEPEPVLEMEEPDPVAPDPAPLAFLPFVAPVSAPVAARPTLADHFRRFRDALRRWVLGG